MAEAGDPALAMIEMVAIDFLHFERLMRLPPQDPKLRAVIAERLRRPGSRPPRTLPSRSRSGNSRPRPTAWRYDVCLAIDAPLDPRVLPGMTATVLVSADGGGALGVVEVPLAAIDTNGADGCQVWVIDPEIREVQSRPVSLGLPGDTTAAVLSGLEPGEAIVAAGVARLSPGQRVGVSSF